MSHKFGFPAMTNRALGNKSPNPNPTPEITRFLIRVTSINLNPTKGFDQIGVLSGTKISPTGVDTGKILTNISPSDTSVRKYPIINEYVWVWKTLAPNSFSGQYVWEGPVSLYGAAAPNANIQPSPYNDTKPPSQKVNYSQIGVGAVNVVDNNLPTISNSTSPQDTFIERSNIHPLLPFSGDVIYEGRWGNSLRLGNTSKTTGQYSNTWSSAGNNGDPITILRNGQDPNSSDFGAEPIIENIKKDLSSIYLTSTQKLSTLSLTNENFISYTTPPITPAIFNSPQIALNSDRVILNAKTDSVLISGQKSVGLSSNDSINLETTGEINISSKLTRLGNIKANQSVLRGDETVAYLKVLITELQNIAEALKVVQDWPSGAPVPNHVILTAANSALEVFENVYNEIDSVKSKIVKTV
jgi:hypothetical protein